MSLLKNLIQRILLLNIAVLLISSCALTQPNSNDTASPQTARSITTVIEDENIELQTLKAIFNQDKLWQNSDIDIVSFNRVILLLGQAPTKSLKEKASEVAKNLNNIKKVYNEIRVAAPTSTLTYIGDLTITTKVKAALFTEDNFDSGKIKVVTEDSEVFLLGLVTRNEAKKAVDITRNVSGVKRVIQAFELID